MRKYLEALATDQRNGPLDQVLKWPLWGLSKGFQAGAALRARLYEAGVLASFELGIPVICVGNLTWGGVGKTPLVAMLARALADQGLRPVILSRGYMTEPGVSSDEVLMLRRDLPDVPVVEGADRYQRARDYLKAGDAGVFIMDDGYQHLRLRRRLNIVVMDAVNPWGNGHLLPRGILREPLTALRRADRIVVTRASHPQNQVERIRARLARLGIQVPVFLTRLRLAEGWDVQRQRAVLLTDLQDQKVICVAGIGQPERFVGSIKEIPCRICQSFLFEDHHSYSSRDLENLIGACRERQVSRVITTMKDAVKLEAFLESWPDSIQLVALRVQTDFLQGRDEFLHGIFSAVRG